MGLDSQHHVNYTSVIPVIGRLSQGDKEYEVKVIFGYIVSLIKKKKGKKGKKGRRERKKKRRRERRGREKKRRGEGV